MAPPMSAPSGKRGPSVLVRSHSSIDPSETLNIILTLHRLPTLGNDSQLPEVAHHRFYSGTVLALSLSTAFSNTPPISHQCNNANPPSARPLSGPRAADLPTQGWLDGPSYLNICPQEVPR